MDKADLVTRLDSAPDKKDLFEILTEFFASTGFGAWSYIVPSMTKPGLADTVQFGYPAEWVKKYQDGLNLLDPFPVLVARAGRPIQFSRIHEDYPATAASEEYLRQGLASGVTDGFIIPTFGPRQHLAAFTVGQIQSPDVIEKTNIPSLHCICQAAHLRIDQLEDDKLARPRLAPREIVILYWVARGKSNADIAAILGISQPTVATHLKRAFAKLAVNDRAAAAVKGVKYGLINAN